MTIKHDTPTFRSEVELAAPVARYLRNKAFGLQDSEVPFYEYRMDVYGYSESKNLTVAVELKLKRWPRAVEQALLYQLCSDLVYIAMPETEVRRVDVEELEKHGLGLIAVGQKRCREVVKPKLSSVLHTYYKNEYVSMLQGSK